MIIIGKNAKDKGAQLEILCSKILESLGYKNCRTNTIDAGGEELDIIGEFSIPTISNNKTLKTLCECKAYRDPVGMTQWLKFLGKVYTQEKRENKSILGCLIALNGVNGNVYGHYSELLKNNENIQIISDIEISEKVIQEFKILRLTEIVKIFSYHSDKTILKADILYYDNNFYWKIILPGNQYTILNNNGEILTDVEIRTIHDINYNETYISLKDELEKTEAKKSDFQNFISSLFNDRNFDLNKLTGDNEIISEVLTKYVQILKNVDGKIQLIEKEITNDFIIYIMDRFIDGYMKLENINSLYNSKLFQERCKLLVHEISIVQNKLVFNLEEEADIAFLISKSLSAMKYAITPDPLIINQTKVKINEPQKGVMEEFRKRIFIRKLFEKFNLDFDTKEFRDFFYNQHGIVEVETIQTVIIKSKEKFLCQTENKKRIAIGQAAESLGGGLLPILVLDDSPEPWEQYKKESV